MSFLIKLWVYLRYLDKQFHVSVVIKTISKWLANKSQLLIIGKHCSHSFHILQNCLLLCKSFRFYALYEISAITYLFVILPSQIVKLELKYHNGMSAERCRMYQINFNYVYKQKP